MTHDVSEDTIDLFPAWSPDGHRVAFVRRQGATNGKIIVLPAEGGPEREIRDIRYMPLPASQWLAWTPDGAQIAFASASLESGRSTLFLMRLADGKVRSLIVPPEGTIGDGSPTFSPDGTSLAFLRWSSPSTSSLLVQKLGADSEPSGEPETVPVTGHQGDPVWADNRRLMFVEDQRVLEWESGASAQQIYLSGAQITGLAIAGRDASGTPRLVTAQRNVPGSRIWMIPLRAAGEMGGQPVLLARFGSDSNNPDYSKDGKHAVFVSRRTGNPELWAADSDGSNARQLTKMGVKNLGVPRWSPDNRHVAFFARVTDQPQIYVVDTTQNPAEPRQVTHEVPGCLLPTWSHDGKFLYCSRRIDEMRLFRVPSDGDAQVEMERWFEGKQATETADGRVLYIKDGRFGLFARSLSGDPLNNPEEQLVKDIEGPIGYFVPVAGGVYYTSQDQFGHIVALRYYDYARKTTSDVASSNVTGSVNSLTISPDGKNLVYTQNPKGEADLTLIEFGNQRSR